MSVDEAQLVVENHELRIDHTHGEVYNRLSVLESRLAVLEASAAEQATLAQEAARVAEEQAMLAQQAADVAEQAATNAEETATEGDATEEMPEEPPIMEATTTAPDTIPEVQHLVFRRVGGTRE